MKGMRELSQRVAISQLSWKSKPISQQKIILQMSYWEVASNERPRREKGARLVRRQGHEHMEEGCLGRETSAFIEVGSSRPFPNWHLSLTKKKSYHWLN